ncbi:MAG: hypothetical protein U0P45_03370 [Acidimicrobiales bacterium]
MTEPVDDPRVRFYLERRELIDEWIEAAKDEPREVERFLGGVADALSKIVSSDEDDWSMHRTRSGCGIYRPSWIGPDREPRAWVGLGWERGKVRFVGTEKTVWVGVRARLSGDHAHTRGIIQQELAVEANGAGFEEIEPDTNNWPVSTWLPCEHENYWNDLAPYRQQLLDEVTSAWRRVAPALDEAFRQAGELPLPEA